MFYKETSTATSNSIMSEFPLSTSPTSIMTPNTIKTIEQSILASLEIQTSNPQIIASAATGSFVPPLPSQNSHHNQTAPTLILANNWQGANVQTSHPDNSTADSFSDDNSMTTEEDDEELEVKRKKNTKIVTRATQGAGRRGGRKPRLDNGRGSGGGGEDDERRKVRRERNKLAAARCRKRRVDHTNLLLEETEALETTRSQIQNEIQLYQQKKEEFEFLLSAHLPICTFSNKEEKYTPNIVTIATSTPTATTPTSMGGKAKRPNTLPVNSGIHAIVTSSGISITTPSNGLNIGFDSWISDLPSTGLTPTVTSVMGAGDCLQTPLNTPGTVRDILNGLQQNNGNRFVSL